MNNEEKILALLELMRGDMGQMQGDIGQINGTIGQMQGDIRQMQGDIAHINGRLDRMEHDISELKTDVNALTSDVNVLKSDVVGLTEHAELAKSTLIKMELIEMPRIQIALEAIEGHTQRITSNTTVLNRLESKVDEISSSVVVHEITLKAIAK